MGRRRRIILPGIPHHVTARGNRRADVFRDTEDRLVYLSKLRGCAERHRVALYSYSLEEIRSNTRKGIPWASVPFLRELERLLGIPLLPRKRGRKSAA